MDRSKLFATFPRQRIVLIVCSLGFIGIVLGCMSMPVEEKTTVIQAEDDVYTQSGRSGVPGNEELDIYYPVPFVSIPNLSVHQEIIGVDVDYYQIVEQHATHFRVRNTHGGGSQIIWQARGLRADKHPPAIVAVPPNDPPAPSLLPETSLPPEPIPISDKQ